jgi:hypothetical protein
MANGWTPERRQRQRELIQTWKPWQQSTGPKTDDGKRRASRNAWKGAIRPQIRALASILSEQRLSLNAMVDLD